MSVSLSVCLLAYLRNRQSKLDEIFCLLSAAVAPSSCDNNLTRYVFPVLWMTSLALRRVAFALAISLRERRAAESSHKFPMHSPGGATLITFCVSRRRRKMYCGHARLCVCLSACLSAAVRPHYYTDPDVTWLPLVVHYWADL